MRRIPTCHLRPGMAVGHKVYNIRGDILLNRGVVLTGEYIDCLSQIGIPALYIDEGFLPDLEVTDVIDETMRIKAINQLKTVWGTKTDLNITLKEEGRRLQETVRGIADQLLANPQVMVNLADIRNQDDYLFAHSVNVCVLSLLTGVSLGIEQATLLDLGMGALMHDIGKLLVPKDVLDKPDSLTRDEFELVKKHAEYSFEILAANEDDFGPTPALIGLQHHERYNGKGYPAGLARDSISSLAQIVGLADVYDAMTADRVYRTASPPNDAYEMLAASGGYYFDFRLVHTFLSNVAAYPIGSVVGLNSGETGVVVSTDKGCSLYPKVRVIFDGSGNRLKEPYDLELLANVNLCITGILGQQEVDDLKEEANNLL